MMKKINSNIISSLPEEILSEILRLVASNSVTDFFNARLSCKAFLGASKYDHISMEKHGFVPWFKSEKVFQGRCKDAGNAEGLYRKGMIDFFSRMKPDSGLLCLKKATEKGHVEAIYTYGIILICFGGELREKGLRVVSSLNLANSNKNSFRILNCRSKIDKFLSSMWVRVCLAGPKDHSVSNSKESGSCNCDDDITARPNRWGSEGQAWEASNNLVDNSPRCDSCFWDREATLFCSLLRKYPITVKQPCFVVCSENIQ